MLDFLASDTHFLLYFSHIPFSNICPVKSYQIVQPLACKCLLNTMCHAAWRHEQHKAFLKVPPVQWRAHQTIVCYKQTARTKEEEAIDSMHGVPTP